MYIRVYAILVHMYVDMNLFSSALTILISLQLKHFYGVHAYIQI